MDRLRKLAPWLVVLLFGLALIALRHQLRAHPYSEIAQQVHAIPRDRLLLALLFTLLSYAALAGYDVLALRVIGSRIPFSKAMLAGSTAGAFSNSLAFANLSGTAVRWRFYSAWGLEPGDVGRIAVLSVVTMWAGVTALAGTLFLLHPPDPSGTTRLLGVLGLAILAFYLAAVLRGKAPSIRGFALPLPTLPQALAQVGVSATDWILSAGVLYALLPDSRPEGFATFVPVFLLAHILGAASHVPGGLGVFEAVVLQYSPEAMGALLAYRAVYYLLPLTAAALALAGHELLKRKPLLDRLGRALDAGAGALVPNALAVLVFASGVVLLVSGATPAVSARLARLEDWLPLSLLEASHFLGSLTGAALLILARGLQRRLDGAWLMTAFLLGAGVVFSLGKGGDLEEALFLAVMLAVLLSSRKHFRRKAALLSTAFSPGWAASIALALGASIWLGAFCHRHVEFTGDLWWKVAFRSDAPRFLRASVGSLGLVLVWAAARMLRPGKVRTAPATAEELAKARAVIAAAPESSAHIALLGDKALLFSGSGRSFLMYGVRGRSWIALGDPVGPPEERAELAWRFREMADEVDGWAVFDGVKKETLDLYLDLGLVLFKLGEEARIPLTAFSLEGSARKGLRQGHRRLSEKEGCSFEVVPKEGVGAILPELKAVSDAWLAEKSTREKGFSLGCFREDYLKEFPMALVRKDGRILAFANLWMGAGKAELSLDLMRYTKEAPSGVMEYLFTELMLWGKAEGYREFTMGMAPLSGMEERALAPRWQKLGGFLFRHGEHFYNFQGLRQYKDKFDPVWVPRYLACPSGMSLPRVLADLSALISGGVRGMVGK